MLNVEFPEVVMEAGAKAGEAPLGTPAVTPKLTVPVKPLSAATFVVKVAVPPEKMEVELGVTVRVKSGAVTFIVTPTLCENPSLPVPVIVSVTLPPGVFVDVVIVSVELPPGDMETGLNDADAPTGRPLAPKVTISVKPKSAPMLTV